MARWQMRDILIKLGRKAERTKKNMSTMKVNTSTTQPKYGITCVHDTAIDTKVGIVHSKKVISQAGNETCLLEK